MVNNNDTKTLDEFESLATEAKLNKTAKKFLFVNKSEEDEDKELAKKDKAFTAKFGEVQEDDYADDWGLDDDPVKITKNKLEAKKLKHDIKIFKTSIFLPKTVQKAFMEVITSI